MNGRLKRYLRVLSDHKADIFSILAGIGVIATGVTAYSAGKAQGSETTDTDDGEGQRSWKVLILPVSCGAATIGCIGAARYYGKRTEKELLAASALLASYISSKERERKINGDADRGDTNGEASERNRELGEIEDTGTGDVIFIEDFTGRRFKASWEAYEYAKRKLQENFSICGFATLNDFYGLLNLSETPAGEVLGWTVDQMILDPFYDGEGPYSEDQLYYSDALTRLCIEEDNGSNDEVIIYYCILPIGSLAGIGPCNY